MDSTYEILMAITDLTSIIAITFFFIIVSAGMVLLVLVYQKKQVQYISEKNQLTSNFEKEIYNTKLEIQEQTFRNISQELHDNIGQVLSLAKLNLSTIDCKGSDVLSSKITDTKMLIMKAVQDVRDLSKSLNTDQILKQGLTQSIEYELELARRAGNFETKFSIEGVPQRLANLEELIIFRIVQEALHNIIKHANANSIVFQISFRQDEFKLKIADDGTGFNSAFGKLMESQGQGITNMHHRAKLINAKIDISSVLGTGTTLQMSLSLLRKFNEKSASKM